MLLIRVDKGIERLAIEELLLHLLLRVLLLVVYLRVYLQLLFLLVPNKFIVLLLFISLLLSLGL